MSIKISKPTRKPRRLIIVPPCESPCWAIVFVEHSDQLVHNSEVNVRCRIINGTPVFVPYTPGLGAAAKTWLQSHRVKTPVIGQAITEHSRLMMRTSLDTAAPCYELGTVTGFEISNY